MAVLKTIALAVLLVLALSAPAFAHGHHGGWHHGPIIIGGPILVPYPVPYPVPAPVCLNVPGRWVWNGSEWVWMPGYVVCS